MATKRVTDLKDLRRYDHSVRDALKAAVDHLGFTPQEAARSFDFPAEAGINPANLENRLCLIKTTKVLMYSDLINEISTRLEDVFGAKTAEMRRWLEVKHYQQGFDGESVKELMLSGDLLKLHLVIHALELAKTA